MNSPRGFESHLLRFLSQPALILDVCKPTTRLTAKRENVSFHAYQAVVKPKTIHRIALRYINRIEITSDRIHLEDYFELRPFIGQKLLQDLATFTLGIQIPQEGARDLLNIQLASIDSERAETAALCSLSATRPFSLR